MNTKSVGIITRDWQSLSQLWLYRSVESIQDHIAFYASLNASEIWNGSIPGFNLSGPKRTLAERIRHRVQGPPNNQLRLRKYIQTSQIKILLVHFADMAIMTQEAWHDLNLQVFVYCHGYDIHIDAKNDFWPFSPRHSSDYGKKLLSLSKRVHFIANSNHTQKKLLDLGIPKEKIKVIYYGVEVSDSILRPHPIPSSEPTHFLFLGRLVDFKGPDLVIKAFIHACEQGLEGDLTIAGDGSLMAACKLLAHDSCYGDRIHFVGPITRDKLPELYAKADVFLNYQRLGPLSNREEAFGVTMLEAMSYQVPVLTTQSGGVQESILDEVTGFLVPVDSFDEYVRKLVLLGTDRELRLKVGQQGREHVAQNFSPEKHRDALLQYLGLI